MIADDENKVPLERRNYPTTAVLEWRVTQLEAQAKETNRLMVENKNEILLRFDSLETRGGRSFDRAIIAIAALASVASVVVTMVHR